MAKWKSVRVRQELAIAAEAMLKSGAYQSLSEFVSEAIQMRLKELMQPDEKTSVSTQQSIFLPERLLCSADHLWTMVTPSGDIRVGLTSFARTHLKGITCVKTEQVGCDVEKQKPFGRIETWMFSFDLHAPVSGKIVKVNETLQKESASLNKESFEAGWIVEIQPNDLVKLEEELRDLMGTNEYKAYVLHLHYIDRKKQKLN